MCVCMCTHNIYNFFHTFSKLLSLQLVIFPFLLHNFLFFTVLVINTSLIIVSVVLLFIVYLTSSLYVFIKHFVFKGLHT